MLFKTIKKPNLTTNKNFLNEQFSNYQVEAEAKQIAEDANRLLQNHNQLLADMQNRRIQLEDLLNRAQTQQETVWQT